MSKFTFIALPVGQGDSFYLKRNEKSVLFDGGKSMNALPKMIYNYLPEKKIDILVCSHNDIDHANGLIGLLDDGGIEITEVWLPGRWREGLERMAKNPSFFSELFNEMFKSSNKKFIETSLENLSSEIVDLQTEDPNNILDENINDAIEALCEKEYWASSRYREIYNVFPFNKFFEEAIAAADRIVQIATKAYNRGCKIRWFDYSEFTRQKRANGGENWMKPLNSVEIDQTRRTSFSGLQLLALSVANKESLVFMSCDSDEPSVLFCADSDLNGVVVPHASNLLASAPHHGAEANNRVYSMVGNAIWVRSDMNSSKRPCAQYKQLTQKYCTICNGNRKIKSEVVFISSGGQWITSASLCKC